MGAGVRPAGAVAALAVALLALLTGSGAVAQGARRPQVVDADGILSDEELLLVTAAVDDAREATDAELTVVVVPALDGRDAETIAAEAVAQPVDPDRYPVVLVLAAGPNPAMEVAASTDDVARFGSREAIDRATFAGRDALADGGLASAAGAFAEELGTSSPTSGTSHTWLVFPMAAIALVSAVRTLLVWRRVRAIPSGPTSLDDPVPGPALVTGRILSDRTFSVSGIDDLVWFDAHRKTGIKRYTEWRSRDLDDHFVSLEYEGTDFHHDRRRDGVPFLVQDDAGGTINVDPMNTQVDAPRIVRQGGALSDSSFELRGLRNGEVVTVGGPIGYLEGGVLSFAPTNGSGRKVLLTARPLAKARRWLKRRVARRIAWTAFWLVLFVVVWGIRIPA